MHSSLDFLIRYVFTEVQFPVMICIHCLVVTRDQIFADTSTKPMRILAVSAKSDLLKVCGI